MSVGGTAMYADLDQATVPLLVQRSVATAEQLGFEFCVHSGELYERGPFDHGDPGCA